MLQAFVFALSLVLVSLLSPSRCDADVANLLYFLWRQHENVDIASRCEQTATACLLALLLGVSALLCLSNTAMQHRLPCRLPRSPPPTRSIDRPTMLHAIESTKTAPPASPAFHSPRRPRGLLPTWGRASTSTTSWRCRCERGMCVCATMAYGRHHTDRGQAPHASCPSCPSCPAAVRACLVRVSASVIDDRFSVWWAVVWCRCGGEAGWGGQAGRHRRCFRAFLGWNYFFVFTCGVRTWNGIRTKASSTDVIINAITRGKEAAGSV